MHIRCNHQLPLALAADMLLGVVNRQRHTNRSATAKPWPVTPHHATGCRDNLGLGDVCFDDDGAACAGLDGAGHLQIGVAGQGAARLSGV